MLKTGKLLIMDRRYLTKLINTNLPYRFTEAMAVFRCMTSSESLGLKRKLKLGLHSKATVTETNKENCQI
jgi:hypothetical protein